MKIMLFTVNILLALLLCACDSNAFTTNSNNVCRLFVKNPHWYWAAQATEERWQVPMSLLMAVINQESHFQRGAEPPRIKILHLIPWFHPSTAEGYAQATNETWRVYCRSRNLVSANRDKFEDAIDFVGWYVNYAHRQLGLPKNDPYLDYLAYHEGLGGYAHQSYRHKYWLKHVARKVERRAIRYHQQLASCLQSLPTRPWWY